MSLRARFTAAAMLLLLSLRVEAEPFAYSVAFDQLFRIDLATGKAEFIGAAGAYNGVRIGDIEGLTFSPEGQLYAVSDGIKALLKIDPKTGVATVIGPINLPDQTGQLDPALAFTCDGTLWMTSATSETLWNINPEDAKATFAGKLGVVATGLVSDGNLLFLAASRGEDGIYLYDQNKAQAIRLSAPIANIYMVNTISLAFDQQGQLWAVLNNNPPPNDTDSLEKWSEYARVDISGSFYTFYPQGQVLGPKNLEYVGLKGLAIAPPICVDFSAPPPPDAGPGVNENQPQTIPSLEFWGGFALALLLLAGTGYQLRRL